MAVAVWLVVPLGSITRLGPLKSHPGALPTSGKADGPNGPVKGRWLARGGGGVLQFPVREKLRPWAPPPYRRDPRHAMGTPALQAGPIGIGVWGMGRREASRETCEHGSYLCIKREVLLLDENPASRAASLNLPGESALGEDGTSGHTFPDLFPPPLSWFPLLLYSEWGSRSVKKEWQEPHFFCFLLAWGEGSPPSTFLRREIDTYIAMKQQTLENSTWKMNE